MKILHITRQFHPAVGGIPMVVERLAKYLGDSGHQVQVIALNRLFQGDRQSLPATATVNGISVSRIPYWGPRNYAIAPRVMAFLKGYDLIHLHSSDFFLDYLAATKSLHHKPIVLHSHGMYFHTDFARVLKKVYFQTITRLSLRQVASIICDSDHDIQLLTPITLPKKLHFIPNGIDYEELSQFSVHNRDPDLVFSVGILTSNKRFDLLLRAFALLVKKRPTAQLVIAGPDRGLLASLRELCCELGIAGCVNFLGHISDEELLYYLRRASLWVSSSGYESFGIALLEAMAAGCVPVVQPLPSFKQLLGIGRPIVYTEFETPPAAAEAMLRALSLTPYERELIVEQIRKNARQYSWQALIPKYEELYLDVLKRVA